MRTKLSGLLILSMFVCFVFFGYETNTSTIKAFDSSIVGTSSDVADDCDWPMFGRTPEGNRVAPDRCGPKTDNLELKWKFGTEDGIYSSPIISNGKVYVGSNDHKLYCINEENGGEIWEYETGDWLGSSPAISNDKVYSGLWDKKLHCLNAENGELVWEYQTPAEIESSPVISKEKVYFGSYDEKLYCLNAKNGEKIWDYDTNASVYSSPVISNGKLYSGSWDKKLYCLNEENGELIWEYETLAEIRSSPAILNGKVYFGSWDKKLYCLNAENGELVWEYETRDTIVSSPTISNGKVYFGSNDRKLYCLNADNAQKVWEYKTGVGISSPSTISNGKVYFGSLDNKLYCLNAENGKKIWEYETSAVIYSSPAISNGKVFVGSSDGYLYCFGEIKTKPPKLAVTSPTFFERYYANDLQKSNDGKSIYKLDIHFSGYTDPDVDSIIVKSITIPDQDSQIIKLSPNKTDENGSYLFDSKLTFLVYGQDAGAANEFKIIAETISGSKSESTVFISVVSHKPMSVSPTSISFGTVDRGKTSIKEVQLTFNTNEVIKGTITSDKRWFSVTPTTFDSRKSPITISCMIEASKLPGKSGPQTAKVQIKMDSGQTREIDVPIVVETQETIDLELQIGRKFGMIGDLRVDLDSPPFIRGGRTLVPVRFISESFGCSLQWEASQKMITIRRFDEVVLLWIGRNYVTVNGRRVDIDTPPVNENGRTYVPIRVISEAFNAMIVWDDTERKLECSYKPPDDGY